MTCPDRPVSAGEIEGYARLARAVLAQAVRDLADQALSAQAAAWIFNDDDAALVEWRRILCEVGDVQLGRLRRVAEEADRHGLRRLAAALMNAVDVSVDAVNGEYSART